MIAFTIGLLTGTVLGVALMCLLHVARDPLDVDERMGGIPNA